MKSKKEKAEKPSAKVAIQGSKKTVVNFNPSLVSPDDPTKYTNNTPAADTLKPNSSAIRADSGSLPVAEAVASITIRRKRSNQMRRMTPKLTRLRDVARNKIADESRLTRRSQKLARNLVRKRFAGTRGSKYRELSVSDRIAVDKMLDGKAKLIARLAQRLMPVVRKSEQLRLQGVRRGKRPKKVTGAGGLGILPKVRTIKSEYEADVLALCLLEGKDDKLNALLKAGLADRDSLHLYKQALANPEFAKRYSKLRDKTFEMLDRLLDQVTSDDTIYVRTKNKFEKDRSKKAKEEQMTEQLKEAKKLTKKDVEQARQAAVDRKQTKANEKNRIQGAKRDYATLNSAKSAYASMQASMAGKRKEPPISRETMKATTDSAKSMQSKIKPPVGYLPVKGIETGKHKILVQPGHPDSGKPLAALGRDHEARRKAYKEKYPEFSAYLDTPEGRQASISALSSGGLHSLRKQFYKNRESGDTGEAKTPAKSPKPTPIGGTNEKAGGSIVARVMNKIFRKKHGPSMAAEEVNLHPSLQNPLKHPSHKVRERLVQRREQDNAVHRQFAERNTRLERVNSEREKQRDHSRQMEMRQHEADERAKDREHQMKIERMKMSAKSAQKAKTNGKKTKK